FFHALDPVFPKLRVRRIGSLPAWRSNPGTPPIVGGVIFLPELPCLARAFGQQVFSWKSHRYSKALCAFADQHDMPGVLDHGLGDVGNVLDISHAADGASAPRWAVHAAGVQFDNAFLVGKAAEPYAILKGVILGTIHHLDGRIERVAATFQENVRLVEIRKAVLRGDNDWARRRSGLLV